MGSALDLQADAARPPAGAADRPRAAPGDRGVGSALDLKQMPLAHQPGQPTVREQLREIGAWAVPSTSKTTVVASSSGEFDWSNAGIGAALFLGVVVFGAATPAGGEAALPPSRSPTRHRVHLRRGCLRAASSADSSPNSRSAHLGRRSAELRREPHVVGDGSQAWPRDDSGTRRSVRRASAVVLVDHRHGGLHQPEEETRPVKGTRSRWKTRLAWSAGSTVPLRGPRRPAAVRFSSPTITTIATVGFGLLMTTVDHKNFSTLGHGPLVVRPDGHHRGLWRPRPDQRRRAARGRVRDAARARLPGRDHGGDHELRSWRGPPRSGRGGPAVPPRRLRTTCATSTSGLTAWRPCCGNVLTDRP